MNCIIAAGESKGHIRHIPHLLRSVSDVECSRSSWWGKSARWRRRGCGAQQQSPKTTEVTSLPTLFALPSNSKMQRSSSATIICPPLHWLSWRRALRGQEVRGGAAAGLWACGSRMGHEMQQEKVRKHTPLKRGLLLNRRSLLQNSGSLLKRFCRCCWGGSGAQGGGRVVAGWGGRLLLAGGGRSVCWGAVAHAVVGCCLY